MEVCNASHYDGATAVAEAGVMAYHTYRGKRNKIIISPSVNPQYRSVLCTYLCGYEDVQIIGGNTQRDPFLKPDDLIAQIDDQTALVLIQYPDFFGRIFDLSKLAQAAHEKGALFAVAVNPMALGMLKTPGEMGADIVPAEGQPLGLPLSFGGPYLGIFCTKKEYVRKISGRLVGETVDAKGRKGYVLTLTAREQHIRRERATSNICTNQGLMALAATVYLSLVGKTGLHQVSELCYHKAHYAAKEISKLPGFEVLTTSTFFNEFVVKCPRNAEEINTHLLDHGFLGGFDLGKDFPSLTDHMLIAVTEMNHKEDIDQFCTILGEVSHE